MAITAFISTVASLLGSTALSVMGGSVAQVPAMEPAPPVDPAPPRRAASEYFLWSEAASDGSGEAEPIAVIALRTIGADSFASLKPDSADFLFELETVFKRGGVRVRHTETGRGSSRRLVWRESLPKASRTWISDWDAVKGQGSARSLSYGWHRPVHEAVPSALSTDLPLYGPLESLALFRFGAAARPGVGGQIGVMDPLSGAIVPAVARTEEVDGERMEVRRTDGSLVVGAHRGPTAAMGVGGLRSLMLTDRRAVARRIERSEFERLERRWGVRSERPYQAVLKAIRQAP